MCDTVEGCRRTTTALKRDVITSNGWPTALIVTLKRFHYDPASSLYHKISTAVEFPLVWTPRVHVSYTLYDVLIHHGHFVNASSLDRAMGHYTANVCDTLQHWYRCDDSLQPVKLANTNEALHSEAYMLFYVKD